MVELRSHAVSRRSDSPRLDERVEASDPGRSGSARLQPGVDVLDLVDIAGGRHQQLGPRRKMQVHRLAADAGNASALQLDHPNLSQYAGDVLDAAAVADALKGHDAVLIALGAGRKGSVRAEGTRNIIAAMQRHGPRRLICQSTLGAGDSWSNLNFFWRRIMFGLLLRDAFADHEAQEQAIRQSGLDWTIVRSGAFTDGPATGEYKHGFAPDERALKLKISRADTALFMLRQLTDATYLRRAPGLSY